MSQSNLNNLIDALSFSLNKIKIELDEKISNNETVELNDIICNGDLYLTNHPNINVLGTNSEGKLISKTISATVWDVNGDNIYNTNLNNVGIGTDDPFSKLHIMNNSNENSFIITSNDSDKLIIDFEGNIITDGTISSNTLIPETILYTNNNNTITSSSINVSYLDYLSGLSDNIQTQLDDKIERVVFNGYTGIGSLESELNIGPLYVSNYNKNCGGKIQFVDNGVYFNNGLVIDFDFSNIASTQQTNFRFFRNTNTSGSKSLWLFRGNGTSTIDTQLGVGGTNTYFNNTNVGINIINPLEKLHVNGNIRSENLTTNTVLISDSNKNITSSTITTEELNSLSGISENIQQQINNNKITNIMPINKPFNSDVLVYYDFSNPNNLGKDMSFNNRDLKNINNVVWSNDRINSINFTIQPNNNFSQSYNSNRYLDGSDHINSFNTLTEYSISSWFKGRVSNRTMCILSFVNYQNSTANTYVAAFVQNNLFRFIIRQEGTTILEIRQTINVLNWNHFVFTMGSSGNSLYINNVLSTTYFSGNSSTYIDMSMINPELFHIGVCKSAKNSIDNTDFTTSQAWNGNISDVMIFNRVIEPELIEKLYNDDYGYDIIPLTGQSNMVGLANIENGVDDNYNIINNIVYQYPTITNIDTTTITVIDNQIINATNPLQNLNYPAFPNSMGLWKTFIEDYIKNIIRPFRRKIMIIPTAQGSTGFIDNEWNKGDRNYEICKLATNEAVNIHQLNKIQCVLWNQGEDDIIHFNDNYYNDWSQFRLDLINDIDTMDSNTVFILAETSGQHYDQYDKEGIQYKQKIYEDMVALEENNLGYVGLVHTRDLNFMSDGKHYITISYRELGHRYYNKLIEVLKIQQNLYNQKLIVDGIIESSNVKVDKLIPNKILISDINKNIISSDINSSQLDYLDVSSSIQTQLNNHANVYQDNGTGNLTQITIPKIFIGQIIGLVETETTITWSQSFSSNTSYSITLTAMGENKVELLSQTSNTFSFRTYDNTGTPISTSINYIAIGY